MHVHMFTHITKVVTGCFVSLRQLCSMIPLLQQLHWLSVTERVNFKLCMLVYCCLHGLGPEYFSEDFRLVSKIHSLQRLHSASSTDIVVPAICRSSLTDHTFLVTAAWSWNALLASVTSSPSLDHFMGSGQLVTRSTRHSQFSVTS